MVSEFQALRPMLRDEVRSTVLDGLVQMGAEQGRRGVRRLRPALLAQFGDPGVFQEVQDAAGRLVALDRAVGDVLGAFTYRLVVDAQGRRRWRPRSARSRLPCLGPAEPAIRVRPSAVAARPSSRYAAARRLRAAYLPAGLSRR